MARRRVNPHLVPDRAFCATITTADDCTFTGAIYGRTPDEAAARALVERGAVSVVVHFELPPR